MPTEKRIKWTEVRHVQGTHEAFFMKAEKDGDTWKVFQKSSSHQTAWYPVEPTPAVIVKCEQEWDKQCGSDRESGQQ